MGKKKETLPEMIERYGQLSELVGIQGYRLTLAEKGKAPPEVLFACRRLIKAALRKSEALEEKIMNLLGHP